MPSSSRARHLTLRLAVVTAITLTAACGSGTDDPAPTGTPLAPAATDQVHETGAPPAQAVPEPAPPADTAGAPRPAAGTTATPQPQAPAPAAAAPGQGAPVPAPTACLAAAEAKSVAQAALGDPVVSASAPECAAGWATSLLAVGESEAESLTMAGVFRSDGGTWAWSERDEACDAGRLPPTLRGICEAG